VKRDPRCDLCRSGVVQTPEAVRAYLKEHGRWRPPPRHTREIQAHVRRYAGRHESVFAGQLGDGGALDVLVVRQRRDRPWKLLVTAGLSDRPMQIPPEAGPEHRFAELAFLLPPDWRLTRRALKSGRWYWPLRLLFDLADYVRSCGEWIWCHHSFQTRAATLDGSVAFNSVLLHHSSILGDGFSDLFLPGGMQIHLLSLWPLHPDELEYRERAGSQTLLERLVRSGVTDLLDAGRPSVLADGEVRMG